jgi:serine phosphatase RsbU (regulator of sigma subunit)
MPSPSFGSALRVLRDSVDVDLDRALQAALVPLRGQDPVVYLADFSHRSLVPIALLRTRHGSDPVEGEEDIASTMAGRAFTQRAPVTAEREDGCRVWVPILEGTRRTGVLAVTVPSVDDPTLDDLQMLGILTGLALAATAPLSDLSHLRRSGQDMSLAATMQWALMPPLSAATEQASIAGVLEPAYDIAGDGFDYAINGDLVEFAILDGMGHGVASSMLTGLAIGAYRHARRQHRSVLDMHKAVETAIAGQYDGEAFATGIIGRLSTSTGELDWSCAGHPAPLLLRGRKVISELECSPAMPYGLGDEPPTLGRYSLQPGDAVLLYTDGVIEARTPTGEEFGLDRLRDLLEREASSGRMGEELLRRLVRAVLDHQVTELRDDATLMLVQWLGADADGLAPLPSQRPETQASMLSS